MMLRVSQFMDQESLTLQLEAHFVSSGEFEDLLISALMWLEVMVVTLAVDQSESVSVEDFVQWI